MDDYVFVFDNTPYTERNDDFMTISIGLKNKEAVQYAVETQYDETSSHYDPSDEDTTTDASRKMKIIKKQESSDEGAVAQTNIDDGND